MSLAWAGRSRVGNAQGVLATIGILAVAAQIVTFKDDPGHPRPLLRLELLIPSVVAAGAILLFGIARLALRLTGGGRSTKQG